MLNRTKKNSRKLPIKNRLNSNTKDLFCFLLLSFLCIEFNIQSICVHVRSSFRRAERDGERENNDSHFKRSLTCTRHVCDAIKANSSVLMNVYCFYSSFLREWKKNPDDENAWVNGWHLLKFMPAALCRHRRFFEMHIKIQFTFYESNFLFVWFEYLYRMCPHFECVYTFLPPAFKKHIYIRQLCTAVGQNPSSLYDFISHANEWKEWTCWEYKITYISSLNIR